MDENATSAPVFQLVYVSAATRELSDKELVQLLEKARRRNSDRGVTGMLIFHEGSFIQVLEGEEDTVQQIYNTIGGDPRHDKKRVLFRGHVEERAFGEWTMGFFRARGLEDLDGLNDFLPRGFREELENDPGMARRALLAFRKGNWRQAVSA